LIPSYGAPCEVVISEKIAKWQNVGAQLWEHGSRCQSWQVSNNNHLLSYASLDGTAISLKTPVKDRSLTTYKEHSWFELTIMWQPCHNSEGVIQEQNTVIRTKYRGQNKKP